MGKRGRKKVGVAGKKNPDTPQREESFEYKPFAAGLADRKRAQKDAARKAEEDRRIEEARRKALLAEATENSRRLIGKDQLRREGKVAMTDEELFRAAIDGLDPIQINQGKYGGHGPMAAHVQERQPEPEPEPRDPYDLAEQLFEAEFTHTRLKRLESQRHVPEAGGGIDVNRLYRLDPAPPPAEGTTRQEAVEGILAPGGPELTPDQRRLLDECARQRANNTLPVTNLRGMTRDVGLAAMASAVKHARRHEERYLRFITGKGLQSADEPVLKVALVEWCEAQGLRYVPEVLPDGSFGAFIVHVPRKRRDGESR